MSTLKVWLKHNMRYSHHYTLASLYRDYQNYMLECGSDEKFIMCKDSMRRRLSDLAREDNPCIGRRKAADKNVYFKKEERIVPIKTNYLLSELGQRAMKLYPNTLKWWR